MARDALRSSVDTSDLPPPRKELPTLPTDMSDIAKESIRPLSPDDTNEIVTAEFAVDRLPDVRRTSIPHLAVPRAQLVGRLQNHREAFLVSLVDGVTSLGDVLDLAGMAQVEAMALLCNLHARGVLAFE